MNFQQIISSLYAAAQQALGKCQTGSGDRRLDRLARFERRAAWQGDDWTWEDIAEGSRNWRAFAPKICPRPNCGGAARNWSREIGEMPVLRLSLIDFRIDPVPTEAWRRAGSVTTGPGRGEPDPRFRRRACTRREFKPLEGRFSRDTIRGEWRREDG